MVNDPIKCLVRSEAFQIRRAPIGDPVLADPLELAYPFKAMTFGCIEYRFDCGALPERSEEAVESFFQGFAV